MHKIDITEQGGEQITKLFRRMTGIGRDFTPLMRSIAGTLADETEQNFAEQGRPKWTPLAESTLKKRRDPNRQKKSSAPRFGAGGFMILQDTGQLASSISASYGSNFAEIGSNLAYARIHQLGGKAGRNHAVTIPARPYLHISQEGWEEIGDAVVRFIERATK